MSENRELSPRDIVLRRCGFRIHGRPNGSEPVWQLGHKLFTQTEALQYLEQEKAYEKCKAKSSAQVKRPAFT